MSVFLCDVERVSARDSDWILPFLLICLPFSSPLMVPLVPPPPLSGAPLHPCSEVTWETASGLFYTGGGRMRHIWLTLLCAKSMSLTFQFNPLAWWWVKPKHPLNFSWERPLHQAVIAAGKSYSSPASVLPTGLFSQWMRQLCLLQI